MRVVTINREADLIRILPFLESSKIGLWHAMKGYLNKDELLTRETALRILTQIEQEAFVKSLFCRAIVWVGAGACVGVLALQIPVVGFMSLLVRTAVIGLGLLIATFALENHYNSQFPQAQRAYEELADRARFFRTLIEKEPSIELRLQ